MWPGGFARPLCPAEEEREALLTQKLRANRAVSAVVIGDPIWGLLAEAAHLYKPKVVGRA